MVSIFIRTYEKDIKWLNYCLQSIHKNLVGWSEIVICIPKGQEHLLNHLTNEKIVTCKSYKDDYIGQQISKLESYKYCKNELILFVDSDVIFKKGAKVNDFFDNNKPVILYDKYENVGDAICWKPITEKLFREEIRYEFMRRSGQLFYKSSLENIAKHFPNLEDYAISQPYRQFSEFNIMGFYCFKNEKEKYKFIDISKEVAPVTHCKQFWSWSGLLDSEEIEIKKLIG